ncbi:MAG: hypothetical protein IGS50_14190 [Synechococcales cyanobacterium C42_A2020_086]|nr:hypothetical protein [Synechococcales cyanobacterium C42_A2020_086]
MARLLRSQASPSQKADSPSSPAAPRSNPASEPTRPPAEVNPGSSVATLWMQVNQDDHPPASIPSTLQPLAQCPQCGQSLAPPLQSSGRQVCRQCGWSNRPRSSSAAAESQSTLELKRLLQQAASESLENMKPRKQKRKE